MELLRQKWHQFRYSVPGRRFEDWYWHRCRERKAGGSRLKDALHKFGGIVVLLAGVVMLVTPGPGWLIIGLGAALLAGESLGVARLLDRGELRLRLLLHALIGLWHRSGRPMQALFVLLILLPLGTACYGLYRLLAA